MLSWQWSAEEETGVKWNFRISKYSCQPMCIGVWWLTPVWVKLVVYLGDTVLDSQWSVLQKNLRIHKTSQTKSQFELTPAEISHSEVLSGCSISGMHERQHLVILKNADEDIDGDSLPNAYPRKKWPSYFASNIFDTNPRALCEWHLLLGFWQTWLFSENSVYEVWGQKELLLITLFW